MPEDDRRSPRPQPPAIFDHLDNRQLTELLVSYNFNCLKLLDRVILALNKIAEHLDSVSDSTGATADLLDTLKIPKAFLK